jgi:hypothetical protein
MSANQGFGQPPLTPTGKDRADMIDTQSHQEEGEYPWKI